MEMPMNAAPQVVAKNKKLLLILTTVALVMLGVGFALIPLYRSFCQAFGLQGSPNNPKVASAAPQHTGRMVEVFFEPKVYDGLPVQFFPDEMAQTVEVGVDVKNVYHFKNLSNETVHFRPVHQVSPPWVGKDFGMKVCFCFNDQTIGPGETRDFPVVYNFAPALEERVNTVTIRYSLFKIAEGAERTADQERIKSQVEGAGAIVTPGFDDQGVK
jgi:cytochrome c oxidase assembly protein subunit 11